MGNMLDRELCSGEGVSPVEEVVVEAIEEEARLPTTQQRPIAPTKAELKEHYPLHLQYRSWCRYCVSGKGHSKHHRRSGDERVEEHSGFTTWHMDYCFFNKKTLEVHGPSEEQAECSLPVLVAYDEVKEACWTMPVVEKGANEDVVQWTCRVLEDSGYD